MSTQTLDSQRRELVIMVTEAKQSRDARGVTDAKADALYARVMAGNFAGLIAGPAQGPASAGPMITGIKASGDSVAAAQYSYERPGRGGNGQSTGRSITSPAGRGRATDRMVSYIQSLLTGRAHNYGTDDYVTLLAQRNGGQPQSFEGASKMIDYLKAQPYRQGAAKASQSLPAATATAPRVSAWTEWQTLAKPLVPFERFATTGEDGSTDFWRVFEYTRQSDGRTFLTLRHVVGGTGESGVFTKMAPEAMVTVARKIHAQGIKESAQRYGRELGRCSDCNRTLTDAMSREMGIGPVCRNKGHWQ